MSTSYKNINLNLFDQNVLGCFRVETLKDGSVRLFRYTDEGASKVSFKPSHVSYTGTQYFNVAVERENREIECIVSIIRSSENCYIVIGSDKSKCEYKRLANVSEVSNFLKNNFCRTLLSGEQK
ncbi:MAG: hypothetical protein IJX16_05430 [Clostridia bacterium]|nr:hypothetical protein [Clostridia bacterium]